MNCISNTHPASNHVRVIYTVSQKNYLLDSDGQIQIAIRSKSRFEPFWRFDLVMYRFYLEKNTHTDTKTEMEPNDNHSGNRPMHEPVIKHAMSSVLNRWEQSSGLPINSKKSLNTVTLANISADTLDK